MPSNFSRSLTSLAVAFALALGASGVAVAGTLEDTDYSLRLPGNWSGQPDSLALATGIEGLEVLVSRVRMKGPPEPVDERDELFRRRLEQQAGYLDSLPETRHMDVVTRTQTWRAGRFEARMFAVFEKPDGTRWLTYAFFHERSALVAEITYLPEQQGLVDRFVRDSLDRVRWKPNASWDARY